LPIPIQNRPYFLNMPMIRQSLLRRRGSRMFLLPTAIQPLKQSEKLPHSLTLRI
jgi:hypothetical protein